MSDFWIGDWIKIITTKKIGKYEGEINGKAKIKIGNNIYLINLVDIVLLPEDEIPKSINKNQKEAPKKIKSSFLPFNNTLDLHIEKLAPKMINERAEVLVNLQIKQAENFINEAIKRKQINIVLIHGKGIGALKLEIEHLLKSFPEVYFTKTINNGGATEILFQYK